MKNSKFLIFITVLFTASNLLNAQYTAADFIGSWALELDYDNNNAGWLEVRQENGYLDADILWRWGSVYPAEFVLETGGHLIITNSKEVERKNESGDVVKTQRIVSWKDLSLDGYDRIKGMALFPHSNSIGVEMVNFSGVRIPEADNPPDLSSLDYGKPVKLIARKDLSGWELLEKSAVSGWSVEKGVLSNNPEQKEGEAHIPYGNLRTTEVYQDFNLKLEVNIPKGSNSGIYLRGIYEIQVMDSYGKPLDNHNMGALYSRIVPSVAAEKPAGEWQEMDITLCKRHVTVILNGKKIIDNQPVKGITGGAIRSNEFVPGPIYLQGDHGEVSYRNMVLTPITY